jgi:hypothetical protein
VTSTWLLFGALAGLGALGGIALLRRRTRRRRQPLDMIHNGCRSEYGPLELRIQATDCSNEFRVFVEDHRLERYTVSEEAVESSLESAKQGVTAKAGEYLTSLHDAARYVPDWRCS